MEKYSSCYLSHGLPSFLSWSHRYSMCQFIERISQQRNKMDILPKLVIQGKTIIQSVDSRVFQQYGKVFNNKAYINHLDIVILMDRSIKKMKTRKEPKKNWNLQQISILVWIVYQFEHFYNQPFYSLQKKNWQQISIYVPGKSSNQCLFKMLKFQKSHLSQYPWTNQEQIILRQLINQSQHIDWSQISEDLYHYSNNPNIYRLPKQCRQHWSSYLVRQLKKGPWSYEQDIKLLQATIKIGKKWTEIGKQFLGRTQNAIKNRCNLLLSKYENISQEKNLNKKLQFLIQKIKFQSFSDAKSCKNQRKQQQLINEYIKQEVHSLQLNNNFSQNQNQQELVPNFLSFDKNQKLVENKDLKSFTTIEGSSKNNSLKELTNQYDVGYFLFDKLVQQNQVQECSLLY